MKLQNVSGDLGLIRKEEEEILDKAEEEIYNIVEEYAREYYEEAAEHYAGELEEFEENEEIQRIVEENKREAYECFKGYLKNNVMGVRDQDGEFKYFEQGYRELVNDAVREVLT